MPKRILILNLPGPVFKSGTRWPSKIKFRKDQIRYYPYPWFMGYAVSLLKKSGLEAKLIDSIAMEWDAEKTNSYISEFKPDYLVCEPTAVSFDSDISFLKSINNRIIKIAVGQFATSEPLKNIEAGFDYVVAGEYEFTLLRLIGDGLIDINVLSREKRQYQMPELLADLDLLPYPERDDTPVKYYNEPSCFGRNIVMVSSRGCRMRCSYCTINNFYGSYGIRARKPSAVVDEMAYLKEKYDFDEIYFDDDNITAKPGHLEAICDEIITRGLKIRWVAMGDALIPVESIDKLAKAGCSMYKFGVEHFDPEVLTAIPKPIKYERVYEIVKRCSKLGIKTHLTFMLGLPYSNFIKDRKMINQVIKINPTAAQFAIATPFPGTYFYKQAKESGWLLKDNIGIYDASGKSAVSYPDYHACKIEENYSYAWRVWRNHIIFSQPKSALFFIAGMARREGLSKTLITAFNYLLNALKGK